jgi:hypothetical protein
MALKDIITEKARQNALLAVIGGSCTSTIMQAVNESGRKARVYDFAQFNLHKALPDFSTEGAEVLFINRIDQAPPSFIIAFMKAVAENKALRGMAVIVSSARRSLGLPTAIDREFSIVWAGGHWE